MQPLHPWSHQRITFQRRFKSGPNVSVDVLDRFTCLTRKKTNNFEVLRSQGSCVTILVCSSILSAHRFFSKWQFDIKLWACGLYFLHTAFADLQAFILRFISRWLKPSLSVFPWTSNGFHPKHMLAHMLSLYKLERDVPQVLCISEQ